MIRRALLVAAVLVVAACNPVHATPDGLSLWVEADGTSYLWNPTTEVIVFDGYQLVSETKGLDVAGWSSIQDQIPTNTSGIIQALGAGALGFGEAAPSESQLAELNLAGGGALQPGAKWSIGKPFKTLPPLADWFYKTPGPFPNPRPLGEIVYAPDLPEPSTWLLATLAGLGLLVVRRRSGR